MAALFRIAKPDSYEVRAKAEAASTAIASRCYPLLMCINYLCGKGSRSYAYPTQSTLCLLLQRHYGVSISRRTLCRWLASLEAAGYIKRIRRIRRGLGGRPEFTSTLYILPAKSRNLIRRIARCVAALWQWAKESWIAAKEAAKLSALALRSMEEDTIDSHAESEANCLKKFGTTDFDDPVKVALAIFDQPWQPKIDWRFRPRRRNMGDRG